MSDRAAWLGDWCRLWRSSGLALPLAVREWGLLPARAFASSPRVAEPLVNSSDPSPSEVAPEKGAHARTVSSSKGPALSGVSLKKGAQNRTVSDGIPAQTPPETPPPNARAGKEPQNQRTPHPP